MSFFKLLLIFPLLWCSISSCCNSTCIDERKELISDLVDKYYAYPAWEAVNTNTYINYIVTTCFQEILGHMLEDRPLEQVELMKALLKFRSLEPFRYPMVELALRVKHELNVHIDVMKVVLEKIFQQLDFNVTYKPDLNHYFLLSDPDLMLETLRISIQKALQIQSMQYKKLYALLSSFRFLLHIFLFLCIF